MAMLSSVHVILLDGDTQWLQMGQQTHMNHQDKLLTYVSLLFVMTVIILLTHPPQLNNIGNVGLPNTHKTHSSVNMFQSPAGLWWFDWQGGRVAVG